MYKCEICGGYLVYLGKGNRRRCTDCGHIQYVSAEDKS
jgi:DNA-directed RNA polymerase subunit RPC12/RpoP